MILTGVSHVSVKEGKFWYKRYCYKYAEKNNSKCRINRNPHDPKWELVKSNQVRMIENCKAFVERHKTWNNREHWCMEDAMPKLIRSRSADFQNAKRECTKIGKVKALYEANA